MSTEKPNALWYLATPYDACPEGHEAAYHRAARALLELTTRGVAVFCPITHYHQMGKILRRQGSGLADALNFWLLLDRPFMERCSGMLLLMQPGWQESQGIAAERDFFSEESKPVVVLPDPIFNTYATREEREAAWQEHIAMIQLLEKQF